MTASRRGRPPKPELDKAILDQTLTQLELVGYDELRMKDVASAAGVGLGAIYRRWPGKRELVYAALRAGVDNHDSIADLADPREALFAGLLRISTAMRQGLGQLIAECVKHPGTELAQIAITAKFAPMTTAVAGMLQRIDQERADAETRAAAGVGLILWHLVLTGHAADDTFIRMHVFAMMGVDPTPPSPGRQPARHR